jgi:hypothetical protein
MIRRQHTFESALHLLRINRPQAMPNIGFTYQLTLLEQQSCNITNTGSRFCDANVSLDIATSIQVSRQTAYDIHKQVDTLENGIKQNSYQRNFSNDWIMRLTQLQIKLIC